MLRIPAEDRAEIKRALYSYSPYIHVEEISEYIPFDGNTIDAPNMWVSLQEMQLKNHFAYPLSPAHQLDQHDPIAYISGNMTKLKPDEYIIMQLLITPVTKQTHRSIEKRIRNILTSLQNAYDISPLLQNKSVLQYLIAFPFFVLKYVFLVCVEILLFPVIFYFFIGTFGRTRLLPFLFPIKESKHGQLSPRESTLYEHIQTKLDQELFETSLRFVTVTKTRDDGRSRMQGLCASLATFSSSYQQLQGKYFSFFLRNVFYNLDVFRVRHRLLSFRQNPILSVTEVSSLFHLPYTQTTKTEDLHTWKSKTLPASLAVKNNRNTFSCTFAKNTYANETTYLGLTEEERRRHMYILGATGTGKTTLLQTMITQDIQNGKGLCVIDPHGDLIEKILLTIPQNRIKDVVLFDPSDIEHPIGMNLLEMPQNLNPKDQEKEKDLIASHLVSIFAKLSPPRFWGPRMENVLRIATLTALETENPTLITVERLLLDYQYRKSILATLTDPILLLFWRKEFAALGSYQKASVTSPITNKLGRFLTAPLAKYILAQKQSKLDFTSIMNGGKILLCNVSKGKLGEDTSHLFGALITAKLQLAALKRVHIPEIQRKDFYLYIDEFQNFATPSFAEIMSEARKYRLNAILAHQTIAQIEDHALTKIILANTGTVISFRASSPIDQEFILPFLAPHVTQRDIANLPSYNFYMKMNALTPQDPFSGETLLGKREEKKRMKTSIINYTRSHYTVDKQIIADEIRDVLITLLNT